MIKLLSILLLLGAVTCQAQPRIKISAEPQTNTVHLADFFLVDVYLNNGDGTHSSNFFTCRVSGTNLMQLLAQSFQATNAELSRLAGTHALTNATAGWGIGQSLSSDVLTTSVSNQVTLIASNSTTAQVDFTTTPDYRSTDVMRANLTLQLTNLIPGRSVHVFLTGDTNANDRTVTVVTNGISGGCSVRWNANSPTNGATSFTVTNNMRAELDVKCLQSSEVWAIYGPSK